jgi:hypothetical protein
MKNIHITPTPKPSRLFYSGNSSVLTLNKYCTLFRASERSTQYVHITSDEEIKEGDWCIADYVTGFIDLKGNPPEDEKYYVVKPTNIVLGNVEHGQALLFSFNNLTHEIRYCKKIILTTDPKLIKDGVQAIDDEFLEWLVKNQSCEKVDIKTINNKWHNEDGSVLSVNVYDLIIPKKNFYCGDEVDYGEQCGFQCENCNDVTGVDYGYLPKEDPNYNGKQEILIEMEKLECKDCSQSLEDCTCIEDTINTEQETVEEYFLSSIKNMLQFNNDVLAIKFMEKYYHAKKEQEGAYNEKEIMNIFHSLSMHLPLHYEFLVREQFKK